jgi:polyvinyl alcohol dehydrogenase (cytochrome)
VGGQIYIGANTGDFYALDASTGAVLWKRFLGFSSARTCGGRGVTSTASVVREGLGEPTVYVGGGDGYLYALSSKDGTVVWKARVLEPGTKSNLGYNWASPVVANKRVYMGVSAQCDHPLIRGGLKVFDAKTGKSRGVYWTVPDGAIGGSVWTTPAISGSTGEVFLSVGNSDPKARSRDQGDSFSILGLDGNTLERKDRWVVPGLRGTDLDFGSSPTLFTARIDGQKVDMVGACNKNGSYYALRQSALSAGPVWTTPISFKWPDGNCLGAAAWDSSADRLIVAGAQAQVEGKSVQGSVRALDPATGRALWTTALPGAVWGSLSINANGVVAVPVFSGGDAASVVLLDEKTGKELATLKTAGAPVFSQPVFAQRSLLVATVSDGLIAFSPAG